MADVLGANNIAKGNDIRLIYTADNDQATAAQSSIYFVNGVGSSAAKTLPAGVTLSGDYSSETNKQDYFQNVCMLLAGFRMETSDTANWENTSLIIGTRQPNGINPIERKLYLTDYQVSTGSGLKKSVVFTATDLAGAGAAGLILAPNIYIRFDGLKKSSSVTGYLNITHTQQLYQLQPVSF